jgi:hypothetical protein
MFRAAFCSFGRMTFFVEKATFNRTICTALYNTQNDNFLKHLPSAQLNASRSYTVLNFEEIAAYKL